MNEGQHVWNKGKPYIIAGRIAAIVSRSISHLGTSSCVRMMSLGRPMAPDTEDRRQAVTVRGLHQTVPV